MIGSPIDNILKPTVRGAVTGFVDIYEAIFPALARAEELQDQNPDMSFSDAYKEAIKGTLRTPKMLEAIRSGENFDLGRGWLKLSTDPSDTDEYKRFSEDAWNGFTVPSAYPTDKVEETLNSKIILAKNKNKFTN